MKSVTEIKKKSWCQKKQGRSTNKTVYVEGTFSWWGLCISSFKTKAYVIGKQSDTCRRQFLLHGLCVLGARIIRYACNRFNTSLCTKDHKTNKAISCQTLLLQTSRGKGRNSLLKAWGYFNFWSWSSTIFRCCTNSVLIYDVLSFRSYYIQFKLKFYRGWGLNNPNTHNL